MTTPVVWIEWLDAVSDSGWSNTPEPPTTNVTVGFLVHDAEDYIVVATTMCTEHKYWASTMTVPKNLITKQDTIHIGWGEYAS